MAPFWTPSHTNATAGAESTTALVDDRDIELGRMHRPDDEISTTSSDEDDEDAGDDQDNEGNVAEDEEGHETGEDDEDDEDDGGDGYDEDEDEAVMLIRAYGGASINRSWNIDE
jgi:hypothetical protein